MPTDRENALYTEINEGIISHAFQNLIKKFPDFTPEQIRDMLAQAVYDEYHWWKEDNDD